MKESRIIITPILTYSAISLILITMDYWNPQQVSHYLGLDLIYGLLPSMICGVILFIISDKRQNYTGVKQ